ncbi:hypothetical protein RRG08_031025 [Elysia crispata]|uniref:Cadherin domain-containing protein n=1 Tax=Elysia crispata TaxID=231223 RepID=A0AAE0ZFZ9_9GAST|nr:hypothetical protein RRG08_031025 [Elysia crispata]
MAPGTKIQTKLNPKYVREDIRSVTLYFLLDDGFCTSPTYSLTVEVEDFNERPRVYTTEPFLEAYEGEIDIPHNIEIIDEEQADGFTYALSRPNDVFDVDSTTGNIVTKPGVSVDLDNQSTLYEDFTVSVYAYDQAGRRSDEANILVRVYDRNDNPPYFTQATFNMAANECMDPGSIVGQVEGKDDDSEYNQNNFLYFGGGGSEIAVMATGDVVLTRNCSDGETFSGVATIHDQGIFPGPLDGDPATIVVSCGPCNSTATTTASLVETVSPKRRTEDMYVGVVLGATLGIAWLSLALILVLRACFCPGYHKTSSHFRSKKTNVNPESPEGEGQSSRIHHLNPPLQRISSEVASENRSNTISKREKPHWPFAPLFVKRRKNSNPFHTWTERAMEYYRKQPNSKHTTKVRPDIDLPNGFQSSKRKSMLSVMPLSDVETISMSSEERGEIHLMPVMEKKNIRVDLISPARKANGNESLDSIKYNGVGKSGTIDTVSNEHISNKHKKINVEVKKVSKVSRSGIQLKHQ